MTVLLPQAVNSTGKMVLLTLDRPFTPRTSRLELGKLSEVSEIAAEQGSISKTYVIPAGTVTL